MGAQASAWWLRLMPLIPPCRPMKKTSLSNKDREDLIFCFPLYLHKSLGWASLRQKVPSPNPTVQMRFGNSAGQGLVCEKLAASFQHSAEGLGTMASWL